MQQVVCTLHNLTDKQVIKLVSAFQSYDTFRHFCANTKCVNCPLLVNEQCAYYDSFCESICELSGCGIWKHLSMHIDSKQVCADNGFICIPDNKYTIEIVYFNDDIENNNISNNNDDNNNELKEVSEQMVSKIVGVTKAEIDAQTVDAIDRMLNGIECAKENNPDDVAYVFQLISKIDGVIMFANELKSKYFKDTECSIDNDNKKYFNNQGNFDESVLPT